MTKPPEATEERARQADKIVKNPSQYKICEGCDSIVLARAATCPNCASYRFEEEVSKIISQARILGMRQRTTVLAADLS